MKTVLSTVSNQQFHSFFDAQNNDIMPVTNKHFLQTTDLTQTVQKQKNLCNVAINWICETKLENALKYLDNTLCVHTKCTILHDCKPDTCVQVIVLYNFPNNFNWEKTEIKTANDVWGGSWLYYTPVMLSSYVCPTTKHWYKMGAALHIISYCNNLHNFHEIINYWHHVMFEHLCPLCYGNSSQFWFINKLRKNSGLWP